MNISYRQSDWGDYKADLDKDKHVIYLGWPAAEGERRWWWDTDDEEAERLVDKIIQDGNTTNWTFEEANDLTPTDNMDPLVRTILTAFGDNGYDASSESVELPSPDFGKRYFKITFRKRK